MKKVVLNITSCVLLAFGPVASFATVPVTPPTVSPAAAESNFLRQDVISFAKEWVGSRYRSGSRRPELGFDCSGFTSFVMKRFNIKVSQCSNSQIHEGDAIKLDEARAGDLLFFGRKGHVSHVAMVVSNDENGIIVVHSTSSRGVVVENVNESKYWTNKLICARNLIDNQQKELAKE